IARIMQVLSLIALAGVAAYFVSTDAGRSAFGLDTGAAKDRERVVELLRVVWVALLVLGTLPLIFAEAALWPMRRSPRSERRRVLAATTAGVSLAAAAVYCSLFVFAAGTLEWKLDFSYFRTSRPSDSTKKIVESLGEPVRDRKSTRLN